MASSNNKNVVVKKINLKDQEKLLHDLVEDLGGAGSGRIVDILFNKKDVNEFLIAKKMELTINQVRNILYKLSNHGLVSFIRKKDKRKGWYIYYWTLNSEKCLVKLEQALMDKISNFEANLHGRETRRYYVCKPCGIEVSEETALEHEFSCEECAEVYELVDNSGHVRDIKAAITRTRNILSSIQGELNAVRDKNLKKRERVEKKVAKDEAKKKAKEKATRKANKVVNNAVKKKIVKKTNKIVKNIKGKIKKVVKGKR